MSKQAEQIRGGMAQLAYDVACAPSPVQIATDSIRRDGGTQMRVDINQEAVAGYAERMEAGDVFPPVIVFHDGLAHWLADGFHRVAAVCLVASRKLGTDEHGRWTTIGAEVRSGTRQDAIRFAISANRINGLRRTNADKQVSVRAALAHPEMQNMSDQAIADEAGVSRRMVSDARPQQVGNLPTCAQAQELTRKAVDTPTDPFPLPTAQPGE